MNYYNEHDPYAAQWLKNLIAEGHLPQGEVDERSIEDVIPKELLGYTQCHFFAGIGGWPLALQLAGWPSTRQIWTGSCPCQPFSKAGKKMGFADKRHLWPDFFHLIHSCGPDLVMGEQVAGPDGLAWLDLVQTDLEGAGYTVRAADLCAASVGAPHIRQRLYWMGQYNRAGRYAWSETSESARHRSAAESASDLRELADLVGKGCVESSATEFGGGLSHRFWESADWLFCTDGGKWRPVEPGTQPMAHGVSSRVGRLRGYGNAIVPQVAAKFIQSLGNY